MNERILTNHERETWNKYQRMRVQVSGRLNRDLTKATGLSEADFEILSALIALPDESVRSLALRCGLEWEKSRLSHQLRRMEQRGLVTREACDEDNRSANVRVTALGRRLAEEATAYNEEAVDRYIFEVLTPEQTTALAEIADAVLGNLDRAHQS